MDKLYQLKLEKYSGLGNDFILTSDTLFNQTIEYENLKEICPRICDRHFGIGADGILLLTETDKKNTIKLAILNSDGSKAEMCGNAIRCIGKFLFLHKLLKENEDFFIITDNGQKKIIVQDNGKAIKVEMGNIADIDFEQEQIQIENEIFKGYFIEYGVPHFIIIVPEIKDEYLTHYGPIIEKHPNFKNGTNVDFIKKISHSEIQIRTFERGCGETFACGTGACSAVITGILLKQLHDSVKVCFPGGELQIKWSGNKKDSIIMVGPAELILSGTYYY